MICGQPHAVLNAAMMPWPVKTGGWSVSGWPVIRPQSEASPQLRNRSHRGQVGVPRMRTLKLAAPQARRTWLELQLDRVFGRDKPVATKIALQTSGDSVRDEYFRKTGYCFFSDPEAAADAVAVSFLYSALA